MDCLPQVAPQPHVAVVQRVAVVLDAGRQLGGREPEPLERVGVLRAGHQRAVARGAVGVGVAAGTVVAVAVDVLRREVEPHPVAVVGAEVVELQPAAVNLMVELLGDVGVVGRLVEGVAAAAELVDVVVLGRQTGIGRGFVVGAEARRLGVELRDVGEAVAVAVVGVALTHHAEEVDPGAIVVRDEGAVERGPQVERAPLEDGGRSRERDGVALRLARDDVDHAADGVGAEEGRAAAANHLDALNHRGGELLKAVDRGQRAEDGAAVEQYLRILPLQAVDAQLHGAAVAAVVLDAQARLEVHRLGQVARRRGVEELLADHRDDGGRIALVALGAAGRDDHLVDREGLLLEAEVHLEGLASLGLDLPTGRAVAHRRGDEREAARGEVLEEVVARGVGREAEGGPLDGHGGVGQVLARAGVDDVARDVGVARPAGTRRVLVGAQRRGDGKEQQEQCSRKVSFHVGLFRWVVNGGLHAPQGCGTAGRRGGAARKRGARRVRCVRKVHPDARDVRRACSAGYARGVEAPRAGCSPPAAGPEPVQRQGGARSGQLRIGAKERRAGRSGPKRKVRPSGRRTRAASVARAMTSSERWAMSWNCCAEWLCVGLPAGPE